MLCLGDRDPYLHECISFTCKITLNIDREIERNFSRVYINGESRPSGKGGGHPDPKIRGSPGLQNLFFGPSGLILAKNKGRPPGPSPESATAHYIKEFVRLTMILEFFSSIYLSVWVNPLLMAVLTLIGKPFIVGLPYLRLKSAIPRPHTLMHLFFITIFSWMVGLD